MNVKHPRPFILIVSGIDYVECDTPPIPVNLENSRGAKSAIIFNDVHIISPDDSFPTRY
jgi:hypothetical protein